MGFSGMKRLDYLNEMERNQLDLLVIGGGITGAGISLDAQVRGMKTGLLDMQDFAAGTSSRSTKLVHGGLRYLKQCEMKLVAEVGKERAIVYENGPHVTEPIWMMLPIYSKGTFGQFSTSIGLKIYDFLAGVKKSEQRKMLSVKETLKREPLLKKEGLKGSGVYVEYRTDDSRLTLEVLKEAVNRGVIAVNYTKVEKLLYRDGKVIGVQVIDQISRETKNIYAKKIVNATGPWVDELREKDHSKKGKYLHLTKGVHLVIDQKNFPLHESVYFDTPFDDGRMIFAIPRAGKTYIGTTDTDYNENLINPQMTEEDREYILAAVNYMFPTLQLKKENVESSWAGLRPLIHEEDRDPSEISRKDEVFLSDSGLISIAGGKLTGYRKMAKKVVDLAAKQMAEEGGALFQAHSTENIILSGGDVGGSASFPKFIQEKVIEGIHLGLSEDIARTLTKRYGSNIECVYQIVRVLKEEDRDVDLPVDMQASLLYGIEHEMVTSPTDYFSRRTSEILFDIERVSEWGADVLKCMSRYFNWSTEEELEHQKELEQQMREAMYPSNSRSEKIIRITRTS